MNRAINTLTARIEKINERIKESEKSMEEPEMLSDYEFAFNDILNYESEKIELQDAIQILLENNAKERNDITT